MLISSCVLKYPYETEGKTRNKSNFLSARCSYCYKAKKHTTAIFFHPGAPPTKEKKTENKQKQSSLRKMFLQSIRKHKNPTTKQAKTKQSKLFQLAVPLTKEVKKSTNINLFSKRFLQPKRKVKQTHKTNKSSLLSARHSSCQQ